MDRLVGVPYLKGGKDATVGLDCLGLVHCALRLWGWDEAMPLTLVGARWPSDADPTPPAVVTIATDYGDRPNHVAVWNGDGKLLHCLEAHGVVRHRLSPWKTRIRGVYEWIR